MNDIARRIRGIKAEAESNRERDEHIIITAERIQETAQRLYNEDGHQGDLYESGHMFTAHEYEQRAIEKLKEHDDK